MSVAKCTKIRHIVKLRQMLKRWKNKSSSNHSTPSDVPAGHVAVCVGSRYTRFVVRATHLNHPVFKKLLVRAEEEYGFDNNNGPLAIPCDESLFEEVILFISNESSRFLNFEDFFCRVGDKSHWIESRPLLHGKTFW